MHAGIVAASGMPIRAARSARPRPHLLPYFAAPRLPGSPAPKLPGSQAPRLLSSCNGADDEERLGARHDGVGQRSIERAVGQILLAGDKADERTTFAGGVVAERALQR